MYLVRKWGENVLSALSDIPLHSMQSFAISYKRQVQKRLWYERPLLAEWDHAECHSWRNSGSKAWNTATFSSRCPKSGMPGRAAKHINKHQWLRSATEELTKPDYRAVTASRAGDRRCIRAPPVWLLYDCLCKEWLRIAYYSTCSITTDHWLSQNKPDDTAPPCGVRWRRV